MLKQIYNKAAVAKTVCKQDVWKWDLWDNRDEQEYVTNSIANSIMEGNFKISPFKESLHRGKRTYQASSFEDLISIRLLDKYIRRIYKVKQSDRNQIIKQVKTLLRDSSDLDVIKIDIKKCYESIPKDRIIRKIENDMILAPHSKWLLSSIFQQCENQKIEGLPRGISVSATLAELYLEDIDKFIKGQRAVIYSKRYVDDFLIISESSQSDALLKNLDIKLSSLGLELNKKSDKFKKMKITNSEFNFLGYKFQTSPIRNKPNKVQVRIADEKISKIKRKVALCFIQFKKDKNFKLLSQRINYLATVRIAKKHDNGTLLGGTRYSYQHVNNSFECLRSVDGFYLNLMKEKRFNLNKRQLIELSKKSFYGYAKNKKISKFTVNKIFIITRIWKNV